MPYVLINDQTVASVFLPIL